MPIRARWRSRCRPARPTSGSAAPRANSRIAQAVVFMACAAKSNAVYVAFSAAMADAKKHGTLDVPLQLRNAPTGLMKGLGYGKGYRYAHDEPEAYAAGEKYFPDGMEPARYYEPVRPRPRDQDPRGARARRREIGDIASSGLSGTGQCPPVSPTIHRFRAQDDSDHARRQAAPHRPRRRRRAISRAVASCSTSSASGRSRSVARRRRSRPTRCAPRATRTPRRSAWPRRKGEDIAALLAEGEALGSQARGPRAGNRPRRRPSSTRLVLGLPNMLHDSVPDGRDETANVEVRRWGTPREFDFTPLDHVAIGEKLALVDFEAAGRISGARFVVLKGGVARLHRALIQYMLDLHTGQHGYTEVYAPYLVARQRAGRHRAAAEVRGGPVPRGLGRAGVVPDPDGRGAGDEPRARADPRGEHAAAQVRRAHAVLPHRRPARTARTRAA